MKICFYIYTHGFMTAFLVSYFNLFYWSIMNVFAITRHFIHYLKTIKLWFLWIKSYELTTKLFFNCFLSLNFIFNVMIFLTPLITLNFKLSFMKIMQSNSKFNNLQKQPLRGVPRKRYSENMQQIYRRLPMPKCEWNASLQLHWNRTWAWVFSSKIAAYFQNTFS